VTREHHGELAQLVLALINDSIEVNDSAEVEKFRRCLATATEGLVDPIVDLTVDEAEEHLRHFEHLSLFARRPVPPDAGEVASSKERLYLLVQALRENWSLKEIKSKLRWI